MHNLSMSEEKNLCHFCHQPKASLKNKINCGICHKTFCKDCLRFIEENLFSFLTSIPDYLQHQSYCISCYEEKVIPAQVDYEKKMEQAKQINLFFKKVTKTPVLRRSKTPVEIKHCPDRSEALMRLAFLALEQGFNALIEIDLTSEKNVIAGYQKLLWTAKAYPADIGSTRHEQKLKKLEKPQPAVIPKGKKKHLS